MVESPIIFLWCNLRSVSTAFERAFIQRNDFITLHEPYSEPYYVGPERPSTRYSEQYCNGPQHVRSTYAEATAEIIAAARQNKEKKVFCKDMALYIIRPDWQQHPENPTVLDLDFWKRCTHTFLLRNPEKSIPSLYRSCKDVEGDNSFRAEEAGFLELRILYNFITRLNGGSRSLLIDAADVIENPVGVMKKYCEAIDVNFTTEMIEWKAEKVEVFKKWEGYHTDAEQSTGFMKIVRHEDEMFPSSVYNAIQENMPLYEDLKQYKIQL